MRIASLAAESPDITTVLLVTEQALVLATLIGAIAALPALIDFLNERRKRRERIALSLDDTAVSSLRPRVAGMDALLASIADLIDRARDPDRYAGLEVGNEILLIGPPLAGKKTLAQRIARDAAMDRLITVYNPRNEDVLAKAKAIVRAAGRQKIMLLLPRIDQVFERVNDELLAELDALIETSSGRKNVLVVGTALSCPPDSELDNLFGIKVLMPGASPGTQPARIITTEQRRVLEEVTRFYLRRAAQSRFALSGVTDAQAAARILDVAGNPAEVEDIITLSQTEAIFVSKDSPTCPITPAMIEKAITRVIPHAAPPRPQSAQS